MASCFKSLAFLSFATLFISCGQDGVAPGFSGVKLMYATNATYNGNLGGISGADAKCMSDVNYPGTGTYKAMISDNTNRRACTTAFCTGGSSEHIDWVLKADTEYLRSPDNAVLGMTNAAGVFTSPFENPVAASGSQLHWLGFMNFSASATWHCANWTNGGAGADGRLDNVNNLQPWQGLGASGCLNLAKIICVEQ